MIKGQLTDADRTKIVKYRLEKKHIEHIMKLSVL